MSNDLEKFLQQAAERLKDKIQQAQAQQRPQQSPPPVRQSQRLSRPVDQQVVQATLVSRPELGDDPLSTIDTRPSVTHQIRDHLAQGISQTDERMTGHIQQAFGQAVSRLPNASGALQSNVSKTPDQTNTAVEVDRRGRMASPFLRMLRKPDTLRAAFIAGEIFRRKF